MKKYDDITDEELFLRACEAEKMLYQEFDEDGCYGPTPEWTYAVYLADDGSLIVDDGYYSQDDDSILLFETPCLHDAFFPVEWLTGDDPLTLDDLIEELLSRLDKHEVIAQMRERLDEADA